MSMQFSNFNKSAAKCTHKVNPASCKTEIKDLLIAHNCNKNKVTCPVEVKEQDGSRKRDPHLPYLHWCRCNKLDDVVSIFANMQTDREAATQPEESMQRGRLLCPLLGHRSLKREKLKSLKS